MNARVICAQVDRVFDGLLARIGCEDGRGATLVAHWQDGIGYRLMVSRKADGKSLTKLIDLAGNIRP